MVFVDDRLTEPRKYQPRATDQTQHDARALIGSQRSTGARPANVRGQQLCPVIVVPS